MAHYNAALIDTTRNFIVSTLCARRHLFHYDPETLIPTVEDTVLPYDPEMYGTIGDLLSEGAGTQYGLLLLRDVLQSKLIEVARMKLKDPIRAASAFLARLEGWPLQEFLDLWDDNSREQRESALRVRLWKYGYLVKKSRTRDPLRAGYGNYHVSDRTGGIIIEAPLDFAGLERWAESLGQ